MRYLKRKTPLFALLLCLLSIPSFLGVNAASLGEEMEERKGCRGAAGVICDLFIEHLEVANGGEVVVFIEFFSRDEGACDGFEEGEVGERKNGRGGAFGHEENE